MSDSVSSRLVDSSDAERRRVDRTERRSDAISFSDHPDWYRLAEAIRRQIHACVEWGGSNEEVGALADRAEALASSLEASAPGKRFGLVEEGWTGGGSMNYLPFSPIMGRLNPASFDLRVGRDGDRAVGTVTLWEPAEGAIGLSHGGVVSGIWDEVLAAANAIHKTGGPTGRLTIHYRRPTPLYEKLRFEAWVESIEARKVLVRGECRRADAEREDPEALLTEAEGLFIRLDRPESTGTTPADLQIQPI